MTVEAVLFIGQEISSWMALPRKWYSKWTRWYYSTGYLKVVVWLITLKYVPIWYCSLTARNFIPLVLHTHTSWILIRGQGTNKLFFKSSHAYNWQSKGSISESENMCRVWQRMERCEDYYSLNPWKTWNLSNNFVAWCGGSCVF